MDIDKDFIIKYKDETLNIGIKFKKILKIAYILLVIIALILFFELYIGMGDTFFATLVGVSLFLFVIVYNYSTINFEKNTLFIRFFIRRYSIKIENLISITIDDSFFNHYLKIKYIKNSKLKVLKIPIIVRTRYGMRTYFYEEEINKLSNHFITQNISIDPKENTSYKMIVRNHTYDEIKQLEKKYDKSTNFWTLLCYRILIGIIIIFLLFFIYIFIIDEIIWSIF